MTSGLGKLLELGQRQRERQITLFGFSSVGHIGIFRRATGTTRPHSPVLAERTSTCSGHRRSFCTPFVLFRARISYSFPLNPWVLRGGTQIISKPQYGTPRPV